MSPEERNALPTAGDAGCPIHTTRARQIANALTVALSDLPVSSSDEAASFLRSLADEGRHGVPHLEARLREVTDEFRRQGSYQMTSEELTHAARFAWRNSIRCIGRQHWRSLAVRDQRHIFSPEGVFHSILEHMKMASDGGAIKPLISVFARDFSGPHALRILNHQIIRYAGYQSSNSCYGDPANIGLTNIAMAMGWKPPAARSPFDILPIIICDSQGKLHLFPLPDDPEIIREVRITHPSFSWFETLNLKWHAVPAISDMVLDAGGLKFPANVFNGWYMSTEIACRNLADTQRYDALPKIASLMGLDQRSDRSLWKDRALVELNTAVLHSFDQAGVRIVDHHTASKQFMDFAEREQNEGRETFGDWSWLVPPISGSTSPIFHHSFAERVVKPGFFYLEKPPGGQGVLDHQTGCQAFLQ